MNDKYFVICYNYEEFKNYTHKKLSDPINSSLSLSNFIYVTGPQYIRGITDIKGYFYGRWREREDIIPIIETMITSKRFNSTSDSEGVKNLVKLLEEVRNGHR